MDKLRIRECYGEIDTTEEHSGYYYSDRKGTDNRDTTVAREAEQQRKRDEVVQRHQGRDRYNAKRKVKRLERPNRDKEEQNL